MLASFLFALQAAAAAEPSPPPAPPPGPVRYVTVPGAEMKALKLLAALAEAPGSARPLRPYEAAPPPFERCAGTARARMYRLDSECLRDLVPEVPGEPPVVALAVVENRRPNITGRVVLKGHTIYCIGARAVGFEDLNDPLERLDPPQLGVRSAIDRCVAGALSAQHLEAMERRPGGGAVWRYAFAADRLARTPQEALGSAHGIAAIRVTGITLVPGGTCRIAASVEEVEQGPGLRRGDSVEISWPGSCTEHHPMAAPLATRGGRFRLYGAWGGGVRFVESLAERAP